MKSATSVFIILLTISGLPVTAQTFRGTPVGYRDQELNKKFNAYQVFELPVAGINTYVHGRSAGVPIRLEMGNQVFEWTLYEHQLLSPDANGTTMQDGRYQVLDFDRRCRTFMGYRPDMAKDSRYTITESYFAAMIPEGLSYVYMEPLNHFILSAGSNLILMYRPSDIIHASAGYCDASSVFAPTDIPAVPDTKKYPGTKSGSRTFSCREFEVAFATDHRMWIQYVDTDGILNYILSVMYFMEPFFDDFDFDFWIEDFFIVTSANQDDTPWGISLDMDVLKGAFEDWADAYFGDQDIGHLWTAGDIFTDDGNGILGRADIGGACGDIGITPWTVLENNALTDLYDLALLQAHEYGHLLDAEHVEGGGTIMEPDFGNIESATWAGVSIDEIFSFIEDETCLQSCIQCPQTYHIIDYIGWGDWRYSALINITSTAVIDSIADVIYQANESIKLTPGFSASSLQPASEGATFVAKIAGCE